LRQTRRAFNRITHTPASGASGFRYDVYVFGGKIHTVKKNTVWLVVAGYVNGLEINGGSCLETTMQDKITT
jgi:hypothetical protein